MGAAELEWCVRCGPLDAAVETPRERPETFGQHLEGVQLATGDGDVLRMGVPEALVRDEAEPAGSTPRSWSR